MQKLLVLPDLFLLKAKKTTNHTTASILVFLKKSYKKIT